jgi:hypothetical protein
MLLVAMTGTLTTEEYWRERLWDIHILNANRRDSRKTAKSLPLMPSFRTSLRKASPDMDNLL